jgi:PhnB protein
VTPHLVCAGAADAIKFYKEAFGAVEIMRLPGHDGKLMHAIIQIGAATIKLIDEMPEWGVLSPKTLSARQ